MLPAQGGRALRLRLLLQEWQAEDDAELCSTIGGVLSQAVNKCSRLEDQTWAAALSRFQRPPAQAHKVPAERPSAATDRLLGVFDTAFM